MQKVAIVYDRVNKWGGAERVLLALHEIYPKAVLFTSVYDSAGAPWARVFPEIKTSFLQKLPFVKSNHEFLGALMPIVFESFDFSGFDIVISVTSEAAKGIITKPGTLHICYCLTPTRYLWSSRKFYFDNPPSKFDFIPFFNFFSKPLIEYLRGWDKVASQRPDRMIAISTEVRRRITKFYQRDSEIIFPPVSLASESRSEKEAKKDKGYFLIVNRLIPYKKVDLAIKVFNKLKLPLYIVGTGSEEFKLKLMSGKNIKFFGQVSDSQLEELYMGAKALIMPQKEDFGIVSLEAQSYGVPVIAYGKGGALDTVISGKTGLFFNRQTVESLEAAITEFENTKFKADNLKTNAKRFSKEIFKKEFARIVENDIKQRGL